MKLSSDEMSSLTKYAKDVSLLSKPPKAHQDKFISLGLIEEKLDGISITLEGRDLLITNNQLPWR